MVHIAAERLSAVVEQVFIAAKAPQPVAQQVAGSLVENNLVGHDSHGVIRVGGYVDQVLLGRVNPHAEVTLVRESATTAVLDGGYNFGQIVARKAMDLAISKARAHDMGMVAIRRSAHTGRLGEYVLQAANAGFMGMVFGSGSARGGGVAPYLGTSRVFNTNPIAWGIPADKHPPILSDFATSACAQGKIQVAIDKGVSIPEGWLLDAVGNPTTDPSEQRRGGVMLPFGLHKGYCLSFMVEVLAGGLAGAGSGALPDYTPDYATVFMAVNIAAFQPLDEFRKLVDSVVAAAKAARKAPGVEEILVPGEPEWHTREVRLRDGLHLPEATWQRIVASGAKCGVTITL